MFEIFVPQYRSEKCTTHQAMSTTHSIGAKPVNNLLMRPEEIMALLLTASSIMKLEMAVNKSEE